jgi:hypothetical protein
LISRETQNEAITPSREQQAAGAADEREEKAFHEQLAQEAAPISAKSGADGEFALTGAAAREKQIRNIGAANEKHKDNGAEEKFKHGADFAHGLFRERKNCDSDARIIAWILASELCRDGRHLSLSLLPGYAGLHPADDLEIASAADLPLLIVEDVGREDLAIPADPRE